MIPNMFAQAVARWLDRRNIHFSWMILTITFLTMLSASAALGLPGAFLQPLSKEFGWTTDQIGSALAVRFVLFGLMAPFSAILMERFGLRKVICCALTLVTAGVLLVTFVTDFWQLVLLWGIFLGVGTGMIALVLGAVVANRWFDQRRGLVLGMLTASSATGQLIFLPIAAWLIEHHGWRLAVIPVVVSCSFVTILAFCLMRNRPQDLGLRAYGANPDIPDAPIPARGMSWRAPLSVLWGASSNPTFWILFGTFFVCGLSTSGLIQTHFISLCGDYGLAATPAASVLAMIGAFDFIGTIGSGWLSDRFDNRKLLFWYYGLRGVSLLWLPQSDFTFYGLSFFAVFYGLDWIATVPPTVKLIANSFGKENAPVIFGWVFAGHQLGGAIAAYGAGLSRSVLLSYSPALYAAGGACLIAACAIMLVRRPIILPVRVARS